MKGISSSGRKGNEYISVKSICEEKKMNIVVRADECRCKCISELDISTKIAFPSFARRFRFLVRSINFTLRVVGRIFVSYNTNKRSSL